MFKLIQCFNMTRSLYEGDLLNCASVYCLIVSHYLQLFFIDFSLIEMHTHWLRGFLGHLSPALDSSCRQPPPPLPWLMSPVQWMPVFAGLVQGLSGGYWAEQETVQWHPVIIITRQPKLLSFGTKCVGKFVPDDCTIHVATEHVQCTGLGWWESWETDWQLCQPIRGKLRFWKNVSTNDSRLYDPATWWTTLSDRF